MFPRAAVLFGVGDVGVAAHARVACFAPLARLLGQLPAGFLADLGELIAAALVREITGLYTLDRARADLLEIGGRTLGVRLIRSLLLRLTLLLCHIHSV